MSVEVCWIATDLDKLGQIKTDFNEFDRI